MGYYRYTLKCGECDKEWASFFASYNMTQGLQHCVDHPEATAEKVRDTWTFRNPETGEEFEH